MAAITICSDFEAQKNKVKQVALGAPWKGSWKPHVCPHVWLHSSQGWTLEAPGQRVPLPSAIHTRSLVVGGTPKPFWEGLQRKVQPRTPQGWQPHIPVPRPP